MRAPDRDWKVIWRAGAIVALVGVAGLLFDIALAMVPGWEPTTTPASVQGWFAQFAAAPWLGMRNLDLLNATLSVVALPMYVALFGVHRRRESGVALLALLLVGVGTALFVANNAALPMLELSGRYAGAGAAERAALEGAAAALLARGAHGSLGAFAGFFLSEVGTGLMALAMLRAGVFRRWVGWLGVLGTSALMVCSVAMTFAPGAERIVMALAAPGGLMMIAWNLMVARGLWRAGRSQREPAHESGVLVPRLGD